MKFRDIVIFNGAQFKVPQGVQRIDTRNTHGWQVRCQGTKMFSDHTPDGSGAQQSLALATRELLKRITAFPAPVLKRRTPGATKGNHLPSGISGPIVRARVNSQVRTASLSVSLPQHGQRTKCTSVYIGSEGTYTLARFKLALARAVELRARAAVTYELAAARAKRRDGSALRASLRQPAPAPA